MWIFFRNTAGNERAFTMIYVETNSIIGSENLAFEEYFLKKDSALENSRMFACVFLDS